MVIVAQLQRITGAMLSGTLLYLQLEQQQRLSVFGVSRLAQAFRDGENGVKKNQERAAKLENGRPHDTKNLLGKVVL